MQNEKAARQSGSNTELTNELHNMNHNPNIPKLQPPTITVKVTNGENAGEPRFCFIGMRIVCDECALPLSLYGGNFIESYSKGRANILRCLCDIHAAERGWIQ